MMRFQHKFPNKEIPDRIEEMKLARQREAILEQERLLAEQQVQCNIMIIIVLR